MEEGAPLARLPERSPKTLPSGGPELVIGSWKSLAPLAKLRHRGNWRQALWKLAVSGPF
jgi:hypothetical protein